MWIAEAVKLVATVLPIWAAFGTNGTTDRNIGSILVAQFVVLPVAIRSLAARRSLMPGVTEIRASKET